MMGSRVCKTKRGLPREKEANAMKRTSYAGILSEADLGRRVTVAGWVQARRDMGGVIFVDLRDCTGTLQLVLDAMRLPAEDFALAEHLRNQSVIAAPKTSSGMHRTQPRPSPLLASFHSRPAKPPHTTHLGLEEVAA